MAEKKAPQTVSEVSDWIIMVHAGELHILVAGLVNKEARNKFADNLIGRYPGKLGDVDRMTVVDSLKAIAVKPEFVPKVKAKIAEREALIADEQERRQASRSSIETYARDHAGAYA